MKTKILLGMVIINIVFIGAYLIFQASPLAAVDTANAAQATAKSEAQQPSMQPLTLSPTDQMEILRQREEKLRAREMELKELEKQLQEKMKKLEALEASIKEDLNAYRAVSGERIKHLVKIYSSMKPNAAATLMNNIDSDVAVQVFLGMKGDIAGSILAYMEPVKAAGITQKLLSYRSAGAVASEAAPAAK